MILERVGKSRLEAKELALARIQGQGLVTAESSRALMDYWRAVLRRVDHSYEPQAAERALAQLGRELQDLRGLRTALNARAKEADSRAQLTVLDHLIQLLTMLFERMNRRWRMTREAGWAYVGGASTAFPKKHPLLGRDPKKDKPRVPHPEPPKKRQPDDDEDEE